jgi:hypothetical protein
VPGHPKNVQLQRDKKGNRRSPRAPKSWKIKRQKNNKKHKSILDNITNPPHNGRRHEVYEGAVRAADTQKD